MATKTFNKTSRKRLRKAIDGRGGISCCDWADLIRINLIIILNFQTKVERGMSGKLGMRTSMQASKQIYPTIQASKQIDSHDSQDTRIMLALDSPRSEFVSKYVPIVLLFGIWKSSRSAHFHVLLSSWMSSRTYSGGLAADRDSSSNT